ncbi:MAG: DM13 domain-containing protein [Nitrospinales bacterium]
MAIRSGNMVAGDSAHPASGIVTIVGNTVNLVDVQISEAPDGRVILANDFDSETGVRLGNLKAFTGSHDYSIPEGTDVESYNTILIWCDQFNVPIGKVKL